MIVTQTPLIDCFIIEPPVYGDDRGYFSVIYDRDAFAKAFKKPPIFITQNESQSSYGVLRGLHAQKREVAQTKLVRCVQGTVLDVVVDHRPESPTYLKHFSIKLTSDNYKQLLIPAGFLHGFVVLSDMAIVNYQVDKPYCPDQEYGVRYNDPNLGIDWILPTQDIILSPKDQQQPYLKSME